jgi:hypothetical protein
MSTKSFTRSFAGGEVSPYLYGRLDLVKTQTGLAKCLNFLVTPQGPIDNRPGFEYVLKTRTRAALIPFTYNSEQSFALEFGAQYVRFHTLGGTLLEDAQSVTAVTVADLGVFTCAAHGYSDDDWVQLADMVGMETLSNRWGVVTNKTANTFRLNDLWGNPISTADLDAYTGGGTVSRVYEIETPYGVADVFDMHFVQSADVLTIVHQDHTPHELRRLGATNWTLTEPSFAPTIATPDAPTLEDGGPLGGTAEEHRYLVTAIAAETQEESFASGSVAVEIDLTVAGNYVDITPPTMATAVRFNVYKYQSGIYGYIGQTSGTAFRDNNIVPDMSKTPPVLSNTFIDGAISSVTVTDQGDDYNTDPDTGGGILSVAVTNVGSGYVTPMATVAGGGGSGATLTPIPDGSGGIGSITVNTPGSLYRNPIVTITDAGGGGGAITVPLADVIVPGPVTTLAVVDADGAGAVVEPVVAGGGKIKAVRIVEAGMGYTAPTIDITEDAGGSGAEFEVEITSGEVSPQAVGYFEQRRVFGGSAILPQTIWMTRSGTESNMTYSIPTQDDDSITARIVARESNVVRHLVPLNDLIALTSGGVWRIAAPGGEALTPANISAKPQSYVGASMVSPVVTNQSILYAPERGSHIREISYKWESQSYQADDVSVLAPHLFDFESVVQLAYSQTPYQVLWTVRGDGVLLGMTYQPEHQVKAWHQHTTNGTFESVCAIPEGDEDGVYVIVQRSINGENVHYVERQHSRQFATLADAFFVDAGATYDGTLKSTITGLHHLEGKEVVALADGGVEPAQEVVNGTITLQAAARKVHVGLAYECDAQSLPFASEALAAFGQSTIKNVNEVALRVLQSSGIFVGPTFEKLTEYAQRTTADDPGDAPGLITGTHRIKPAPSWAEDGTICIRQANPLPLSILSMALEVSTGG